MTRYAVATIVTVCVLGVTGSATAGVSGDARFFEDCISVKIGKCLNKARMIQSRSCCRRQYGEMNLRKAIFYHQHRMRLVDGMLDRKIDAKPYKVEYYLIRAFGKELNKTASPTK